MNNQTTSRRMLPTNRSYLMYIIRGLCSFLILAIIDVTAMRVDLNTILKPYTSKRANILFFSSRTAKLMNEELKRRGINYQLQITLGFCSTSKMITALNLLCEDYNKNG